MTDYYRLIVSAVADPRNADATRRAALYDCARKALVKELSSLTPPLSESEIARERLSLEAAIHKIEAGVSRPSQVETQCSILAAKSVEEPRKKPSAPEHGDVEAVGAEHHGIGPYVLESKAESTARNCAPPTLTAEALEALKLFRECVSEAELRSEAEIEIPARQTCAISGHVADRHRSEPGVEPQKVELVPRYRKLETPEVDPGLYLRPPRPRRPPMAQRQAPEAILPEGSHRSSEALFSAFVCVFLAAALVITLYWQRDRLSAVLMRAAPITAAHDAVQLRPEILGSIGPTGKQGPSAADQTPTDRVPEPLAQSAVLYEEDPADANGKRYAGSVIWRTEPISPGQPLAVRAQLEIPERHISMTMSLRPNTDKQAIRSRSCLKYRLISHSAGFPTCLAS